MPTEEPKASSNGWSRRLHTTTSGMLLAWAAAPVGILDSSSGSLFGAPLWQQIAAAAASASFAVASFTITRTPDRGRTAATLAIALLLVAGGPALLRSPLAALASLVTATSALVALWPIGTPLVGPSTARQRPLAEGRAQGAAIAAFVLWLVWSVAGIGTSAVDSLAVGWAMAVSALFGVQWALANLRARRGRAVGVLAPVACATAVMPVFWGHWWWMASALAPAAGAAAVLVARSRPLGIEQTSAWEPLLGHPERLFVGTFAALCILGTILLALPQSATAGEGIGFVDAAFTSTSAVCVTGLVVRDTPVELSVFGQIVVLLLIQVGGLGIMTFSTVALATLGRRMSLRHEGAVASLLSTQDRGRVFATARQILVLTVAAEAVGALVLAGAFLQHGDAPGTALWRGVFTSISAFCNAGFALQSDSLVPYQASPLVLHTVALLIVLGGLSPLTVLAVPAIALRSPKPVSAQARLSLAAAGVLLAVGFLFMLTFEWNGVLRGLSWADRLHNAWFQSVTLRTAGFNSVDLALVRPATYTLMLLWMFTGGSPGGTAGGVKTTTVSVLVLSVVEAMRGRWTLEVFGKRISDRTRAKAAVTVVVAATTGVAALVAIQLTQAMPSKLALFEVVSAMGTVGLSIGGTAQLDGIGKAIIIASMFVGRVGGLSLLLFLSSRRGAPAIGRPEEEIDVG